MKKLIAILILALSGGAAWGQSVPATLTLNWTNPTTTIPPASLPLTGAQALVETHIVISTSPIPADYSGPPTVVVAPTPTTASRAMNVPNGSTLYARLRTCNRPAQTLDCSAWTNEVSKVVNVPTTPNVPTNVTMDIVITFSN